MNDKEKQLNLRILITAIATVVIMVAGLVFWKFKKYDQVNKDITTASGQLTTAQGEAAQLYPTLQAKVLESQKKRFRRRRWITSASAIATWNLI